jgi:hypothetical protein
MSYENMQSQESQPRRPPFFFRDDYANLIVKGNFMTLAAKPVLVEEGEWLAHQGMLSSLSYFFFFFATRPLTTKTSRGAIQTS